jgi:hypothetical protein
MGHGISHELATFRARTVSDVRYDLTLDVTALDSAIGTAVIRFKHAGPADVIIDFRGRRLTRVIANGAALGGRTFNGNHLRIPAGSLNDGENVITLDFVSEIAASGASIIRTHDPDGSDYLYTLLVPADANQLFPCFDQPDLKARWKLSLDIPSDWAAVANGAEKSKTDLLWFDPTQLPSFTGTVDRYLPTPDAQVDRLVFKEGPQIVFPPDAFEAVQKVAPKGQPLVVWGIRARNAAVITMLAFAAPDGEPTVLDRFYWRPEVGRKPGRRDIMLIGKVWVPYLSPQGQTAGAILENGEVFRIGSNEPIKVNVRMLSATNRDLDAAVNAGTFRRDLFFRLQVVQLDVPPLRDRASDISILADHFLKRFARETGRKIRAFTPAALEKLQGYAWPGNVRELKNVIERAVALGSGPTLDAADIWLSELDVGGAMLGAVAHAYKPEALEEVEKRHILETLKHTDWNKSQAAAILGIERSTLDRKIKAYGLAK